MTSSQTTTRPKPPRVRETFSARGARFLNRYSMAVALVLVVVVFAFTTKGILLRDQNISNLVVQNGYILILAIGMVMVIIGGHIDLSVGSIAGFAGAAAAILMVQFQVPWWIALILSLVVGGLAGAFQGFWVAYAKVPSFIVTLAGMLIFRGLTIALIGARNIGNLPEPFVFLGAGYVSTGAESGPDLLTLGIGVLIVAGIVGWQVVSRRRTVRHGEKPGNLISFIAGLVVVSAAILWLSYSLASFRGLPVVLIILVVLGVGYTVLMTRTVIGRHIYAVGSNRQTAQLSGVKDRRIDFFLFVNMGVLAALAGVIITARLNLATSGGGTGLELEAIAAAFVGGAAVAGGTGSIAGALVGGLTIGIINNGMSIMGLGTQWQQTVLGVVVLLFVAFDIWNKGRRTRR
ncbi:multiple monosaccharide ABC transporter permease [Herbiconiux flava]|uniref:Xylose transport system permease protein XylH n=1 Tax=Herbiconiux flava TaxID=881268 RepID=A0A852SR20_9MICO|nr:multiple monosaccharide ABC transporter permease [Herbiconiux flava]NYD71286.1 putative multiple sugar transport system permease protein [Herbiconiux flava]GLK18750.1 ABC transporter permease [Herbiconiux flava]